LTQPARGPPLESAPLLLLLLLLLLTPIHPPTHSQYTR
jgi:hypothetical protein